MTIKQIWCRSFPFFFYLSYLSICILFHFFALRHTVIIFFYTTYSFTYFFLACLIWFYFFTHIHAVSSFLWYTFCNGLWMHKFFCVSSNHSFIAKNNFYKKLFHVILLYIVHCAYKVLDITINMKWFVSTILMSSHTHKYYLLTNFVIN